MSFDNLIASEMLDEARLLLDLGSAIPMDIPYLVILGGQPGSGKSSAIELIEARFNDNIVSINGDDFKRFHPDYKRALEIDPIQAVKDVQPYSNYVVNELKKELSDNKYNIIIEGTMRTSEVPLSTIDLFKAKGYQVEAYVVASNYYASRVGCLKRLEIEISEKGHGRAVPVEAHDEAYKNIPVTMQKLIDSGKLENLIVMTRNGEIIAELKNDDNVVDMYQIQRNLLSKEEYTQVNNNLNLVIKMMHERNAKHDEIQNVVKLQEDVQTFFSTQEATRDLEIRDDEEQFDFSL